MEEKKPTSISTYFGSSAGKDHAVKHGKRRLAVIVMCLMLLSSLQSVSAVGEDEESWESLVDSLVSELHLPGIFSLGYRNTVTGEEHYYNGDEYLVAASLYKLPLCMIYAERVNRGELSWDYPVAGSTLLKSFGSILTYSSNYPAEKLLFSLGDYPDFRALCAEYVGEDPEDPDYLGKTNRFTARQLTRAAALLASESERFPNMIEPLKASAPGKFLKYADVDYDIAQKYGTLTLGNQHLFHVCGIVYTDEPIVLTVMTLNVGNQRGLMERYCTLMCEYAQAHAGEQSADKGETASATAMPDQDTAPSENRSESLPKRK